MQKWKYAFGFLAVIYCLLAAPIIIISQSNAYGTYSIKSLENNAISGDGDTLHPRTAASFSSPEGIAIDLSGNVYIADMNNNRVQKFSASGAYLTEWGSYGSGNGQFVKLVGIAVNSSANAIYTVEINNLRVQEFTPAGSYVTKWGGYGTGPGQFKDPEGVAIDSSGNVYVTDTSNSRVQKFTSSGSYITEWGTYGSGNGQFNIPWGIAIDSFGYVYVVDFFINRVQKFTSSGTYVTKWGSYGSSTGQFKSPSVIAIDASNNVYVVDEGNFRVQKFTSSGSYITSWGSQGLGDGQFESPEGIAIDPLTGNVFVSDATRNDIQMFTNSGLWIGNFQCTTPSAPRNLQGIAGSEEVTLSWQSPASNGGALITNYSIYRGTSSGGETKLATIGTDTSYEDTGLVNGQTYYYKVSATNWAGEGPLSNEASKTPANPPTAPQNLTASAGDGQVVLLWQAPTDDGGSPITNYAIYRGTSSGGETKLATNGTALSYTDKSVVNGQTYYYKVSAINSAQEGPLSGETSAKPMAAQDSNPTDNGVLGYPVAIVAVFAFAAVISLAARKRRTI